jgi:PAS domain S-box-containing protein
MINFTNTYQDHTGIVLKPETLLERLKYVAACITDHRGYYLEVNEAYCKLYGYTREELERKSFLGVVPPAHRAFAQEVHDGFIAGIAELPARWTVVNRAGESLQIWASAIRIKLNKKGNEGDGSGTAKMTMIEIIVDETL